MIKDYCPGYYEVVAGGVVQVRRRHTLVEVSLVASAAGIHGIDGINDDLGLADMVIHGCFVHEGR